MPVELPVVRVAPDLLRSGRRGGRKLELRHRCGLASHNPPAVAVANEHAERAHCVPDVGGFAFSSIAHACMRAPATSGAMHRPPAGA